MRARGSRFSQGEGRWVSKERKESRGRKEGGKKEERREERREGKEGGKEGRKGGRTIEDDRKRMKEIEREKNITPIKITSNPF